MLERYDNDGSIDASFGDGGKTITNFGQDFVLLTGLALEPDGSIVTAGFSYPAHATNPGQFVAFESSLTLARFQNDSLPLVLIQPPPAVPPQSRDKSTPVQPIVPSAPPPVTPNALVFTPAPSAVIAQTPPALVTPSFGGQTAVVNTPATASDPFGIRLVGGSGPGIVDATVKLDDFPLLSPDFLMGDGSAGAAESARADFHQEYLARQGLTASFAKCCVPRGEVACPAVRAGDLIKR